MASDYEELHGLLGEVVFEIRSILSKVPVKVRERAGIRTFNEWLYEPTIERFKGYLLSRDVHRLYYLWGYLKGIKDALNILNVEDLLEKYDIDYGVPISLKRKL